MHTDLKLYSYSCIWVEQWVKFHLCKDYCIGATTTKWTWGAVGCVEKIINICDPVPLNEALWGEYQNLKKKVIYCNKCYFLNILVQKSLLYHFPIKSYKMFHIAVYNIIQNHITEIWGVKDCNLYTSMGQWRRKMFYNSSFLLHFHWNKCLSWLCFVWVRFRKNISKMKNFDLGS